jgi:hypothetical protein
MNNSTIIRVFAEATALLLLAIGVFVWPIPALISAASTIAVFVGGFLVIVIVLGIVLYVNKRIKDFLATSKK